MLKKHRSGLKYLFHTSAHMHRRRLRRSWTFFVFSSVHWFHFYFGGAKYCNQRDCMAVCLFVCLSVCLYVRCHISKSAPPKFTTFSIGLQPVAVATDSIILWRQCIRHVVPVLWMSWRFHNYNGPKKPESKTTRMFRTGRQVAAPAARSANPNCILFFWYFFVFILEINVLCL